MSVLPNSHQALLKNTELLQGRVALLGVTAPGLLTSLARGGIAMSEHYGDYQALAQVPGWQALFGYEEVSSLGGCADTVVTFLPKTRAELSMRLALACWLGDRGARLVMIGEKREGVAGAVKQLQEIGPGATKVDSARHCQVWLADGLSGKQPFNARSFLQWHQLERAGVLCMVAGLPGVFSEGHLDEGTAVLLDTCIAEPLASGPVLDFACGAGVIGAWLQLWQQHAGFRTSRVDGVDVQAQALVCARETYQRAEVAGTISPSDGLDEVVGKYATILTNPPFHSGIKTDTSMTERFLQQVARHLQKGGELRLVANSFLSYEALIRRYVGPVSRLHTDKRFTVYSARRH